jgi:hypothetical protein
MRPPGNAVSGLASVLAALVLVAGSPVSPVPAAVAAVAEGAGATTLTAPDVRSSEGTTAAFAATGLPADASGTVSFTLDGTDVCSGAVAEGAASCDATVTPGAGAYTVTASYSGDAVYAGATDELQWVVFRTTEHAMVRINAPRELAVGRRALVRARLGHQPCNPYVACRTAAAADGVITWRLRHLTKKRVQWTRRTVVADDRARWRTPRLTRPGRYVLTASYDGGPYRDSDNTAAFRVVRR